ncbi:MAG: ATP-binding cassette domain-containing protein, partial [Allobaculum sp.]|nr:ATP-binding cassette domain-containing protein [Allobaculum sp.]
MEAINLENLSFSYDGETPVLKDISLKIPKGSSTAIVGHNGSGKSTLAKLIIGLLEPSGGKIEVLGQTVREDNLSEIRDHVGIVFQNPDN